ncbi:MAG: glycosyltransferase family 9 protein [Syntrophales bacterium LBB04]|nr:glycosyltransferase family 9 protein [Syntrophales bacterium LBB04]
MKDLLVIQLSRLGDLIQTLPLIKAYKDDMPECRVTLLCVREFAPVLGGARFIDRVVSIPFSRIKAALQADHEADIASLDAPLEIPELRETYDRVVNLTHTLGSAHICSRVPARARNGRIETYPGEIRVAGDWGKYLFCITKSRTLSLFNLVDVYMGLGGVSPRPVSDYLEVTRWQREQALQLLEANGYTGKGPLIGLHMGANRPHRTWGISNFARLAGEAVNEAHSEIVLIGGPGEADMGEQFLASAQVGAINLIGRTDLQILPGVLSHCDLLVTNDTGPAHIAAAVGTKVVGIFFSTAFFGETAPYGEGHIVLQAERECTPCRSDEVCQDVACREDIPVAAVSEAVKAKLSGSLDSLGGESEGLGIYLSRFCANGFDL